MDYTFSVEPVSGCWPELCAAGKRIYETFSGLEHDVGYDPDREFYEGAEKRGVFLLVTARAPDGTLAGAGMYFVFGSPHIRGFLSADADSFFVLPEFRRGGTADRLLAFAEGVLRARGVKAVSYHTRTQMDVSPLFRRLGYDPSECVLTKGRDA